MNKSFFIFLVLIIGGAAFFFIWSNLLTVAVAVLLIFSGIIYLLKKDRSSTEFRIVKVDNKTANKVWYIIERKSDFHSWRKYQDKNRSSYDFDTIEEAEKVRSELNKSFKAEKDDIDYTVVS